MIPLKIKEHLDNYIHQEVYVQIAVIKGKEKVSTKAAIEGYFNSNHFRDLSEGRPYDHFIDGLNDKCLIKLLNSPMKDKVTDDEVIKGLQKKLKELSNEELENTFWEIENKLKNDDKEEIESTKKKSIKTVEEIDREKLDKKFAKKKKEKLN